MSEAIPEAMPEAMSDAMSDASTDAMPADLLTQDEVDALLDGLPENDGNSGGDGAITAARSAQVAGARRSGATSPFDVAGPGRLASGRLPALELVNERFAGLFASALYAFTRRRVAVTVTPPAIARYADFSAALATPASLNLVRMQPSCGNALFVFDCELIFLVIDSLFGGDGRVEAKKTTADFTDTEQRLIARLLELVFTAYAKAWEAVHPMQFAHVRSETQARFVNVAAAHDAVIAFRFDIASGSANGAFHVCIPCASIDAIRDLLARETREETAGADDHWRERLAAQVQAAEVELVVPLATVPVTFKQLLEMKVGDVIVLDIKPTIVAEADGVPVLRCRYGNADGRYAVRVEEIIVSREETATAR